MSGSSTLVLIRHGEAHYRRSDGGYLADGALTERGITQAQALADSLRGLPIEKAWTSPCRRARQTAALAGLDAVVHPGLAEWRYRPYAKALDAGLTEADDPLWIWQQATGAQRDAPETLDQLVHRIDAALAHITAPITDGAMTAIVAHGHLLRVLTMRWLGLPASTAAHLQLAPASISHLTQSNGHRFLAGWNHAPWQVDTHAAERWGTGMLITSSPPS
jgi:broad specificity phosphatase PhoE